MNNFDFSDKLRKNQSIKLVDIKNIINKKSFLSRNRSLKRNFFLFHRNKLNTYKTIRRVPNYNNFKKNTSSIKLFNGNNRNYYPRNNNKINLNNNFIYNNNKFKKKNKISYINKINNDLKIPNFYKDELDTKNSIYNENFYSQYNDDFVDKSINKKEDQNINKYINKLKYNLDGQKKSFSPKTSDSSFLNTKKMISSKSNNNPKSFFQNGILNIDVNKDSSTDLTEIINSFINKDDNEQKNNIEQNTTKSTFTKNKINRFNSKLIDILNADEKKTSINNNIENNDKLGKQKDVEWFKIEYNLNDKSLKDLKINENINCEISEIEKIKEGIKLVKFKDNIQNVEDKIDFIDLQEINLDIINDSLQQCHISEEPKLGNKKNIASLEKLSNNSNEQELPSDLTFYN